MSDITSAIKQVCEEKGLSYEAVIATIESALAAAYRKDYGEKNQNIKVEYDPETNGSLVYDVKTVVEDMPEEEELIEEENNKTTPVGGQAIKQESKDAVVEEEVVDGEEKRRFNPKTEIQEKEAKLISKKYKIGDEIKIELETKDEYGRMAAQTAKQVIIQRLREAERDLVYNEYKGKEKEVVSGTVQRREGRVVLVDLGKGIGIIPPEEQVRSERYLPGARLEFYIREVRLSAKGPEIILSRTSEEILRKIFALEIPEIANGLVEIKAVAREAGNRSKVAVEGANDNIDPVGSCVGQRGSRIQTIIKELGGEKIDIIEYDENAEKFVANCLSPAKISSVELNEKEKRALVKVDEDQLSLAIGKEGQNVRLAARLSGWRIDINGIKLEAVEETEEENNKATPVGGQAIKQESTGEEKVEVVEKVEPEAKEKKTRKKKAKEE